MNFKRIAWSVAAALALPSFVYAAEDESSLISVYGHIALGLENIEATDKTKFDGSQMLKVDPNANRVNFGLYNTLDSIPAKTRVTDGISYIGFRGNQSLPAGFTALYQIETAVKPDDGCGYVGCKDSEVSKPAAGPSARFGNRQTFIGLRQSSLGTLQYGRLDMYFDKHVPNELHLLKSGATSTALSVLGYQFNSASSFGGYFPKISTAAGALYAFNEFAMPFYNVGTRTNNVVQYKTPSYKGLQMVAAYQVPETKGEWYKASSTYNTTTGRDDNNPVCQTGSPLCLPDSLNKLTAGVLGQAGRTDLRNDAKELTVAYYPGRMFASLAYLEEKDPVPLVTGGAISKAYGIKGSLGLQVSQSIPLRVGLVYERQVNQYHADFVKNVQGLAATVPGQTVASLGDSSRDTYVVALGYKFSDAIELFGTYGEALDTETWTGEKDKDSGAVYTQLTMLYNFSKKTNLFATYAKVDNESVAAYNFFINGAATPSKDAQAPFLQTPRGSDPTSYQVGISHNF